MNILKNYTHDTFNWSVGTTRNRENGCQDCPCQGMKCKTNPLSVIRPARNDWGCFQVEKGCSRHFKVSTLFVCSSFCSPHTLQIICRRTRIPFCRPFDIHCIFPPPPSPPPFTFSHPFYSLRFYLRIVSFLRLYSPLNPHVIQEGSL